MGESYLFTFCNFFFVFCWLCVRRLSSSFSRLLSPPSNMSLEQAISALVSRLENVTSRLENVEKQLASSGSAAPRAAAPASGGGAGTAAGASSASVREYEDLVNEYIKPFVALTQTIGSNELKEQVN
jgi:ribosomal protein L12E/L44/L45/RPP1/RPP2